MLVVLGAGSLGGYWWRRRFITGGFENAHLEVDQEQLDFGEVWEQKEFRWTLPIHNRSSGDVAISRFISSCRCVEVAPSSLVVRAGETAEVHLTLDLSTPNRGQITPRSRPFSAHVVPVIDDGLPEHKGWVLRGVVRPPFRLSPRVLSFGDSLVAGKAFEPRTVEVMAGVRLGEVTAEAETGGVATVILERTEDASCCRVRVAPEETTPAGHYHFAIMLKGVTVTGERLPPVPIPVVIHVAEDVQLVPPSVTFGSLRLGESAEETVVLRSRSGSPVEVAGTTVDLESGLSAERLSATGGERCFRVRQRAIALDSQAHDVRFVLQDGSGEAPREIRLPVVYYGVESTETAEW